MRLKEKFSTGTVHGKIKKKEKIDDVEEIRLKFSVMFPHISVKYSPTFPHISVKYSETLINISETLMNISDMFVSIS